MGKTVKDLQGQGLSLNHFPSTADAWEDGDRWRKEKRASSQEEEGDSKGRGGREIDRHLRKLVVEMLSGCFATSNSPRVKDRARGLSAGRGDLLSLPASSSAGRGVTRTLHVLTAAAHQAQAGPRAGCVLSWLPVTCHLAPFPEREADGNMVQGESTNSTPQKDTGRPCSSK